jgi:iron complex outermembrane recepter protein
MRKRSLLILALLTGLMFFFSEAVFIYAQETKAEEFTLEEITVTAAKRAENQQKVAISMDVISSDSIKELGKNNIDDILSSVSNTIIEKSRDGYRVAIRGITDSSQPFHGMSTSQPAVAINTDGVYSNRKDTVAGLFDVDRVEVLYGPQSTMYSSNSPGGIVNVVTAQPKLDRFSTNALVEVGNYQVLHGEVSVNAPVSNKIALRASGYYLKRGKSYVVNATDGEDTKSGRLRALYQANDKFSVILTGEISQDKSTQSTGVTPFDRQNGNWYSLTTTPPTMLGPVTNPWTGVSAESHPDNNQVTKAIKSQINWDTDIFTVSLVPSYSARHGKAIELFPSFPAPGQTQTTYENFHTKQNAREKAMEARFSSPSDFFIKWMLGANYYSGMDSQRRESETYLNTGSGEWSDRTMTSKMKALYANVTYPFTDVFRGTVGYRKSWDSTVQTGQGVRPGSDVAEPDNASPVDTKGRPDYKLGFEYDLSKNSMLYGDYSSSFRMNQLPGGGGGPPLNLPATNLYQGNQDAVAAAAAQALKNDPEVLKAYTLGAKNRFLDNKLQVNIAAYYYDYRNYQAQNNQRSVWIDLNQNGIQEGSNQPGPPPPGGGSTYTELYQEPYANGVGNGRMIGVDLTTNAIITQSDQVNLSVAYQNSKWTNLKMLYYFDYVDVLDQNNVAHRIYEPFADYTGKSMMNTPPWTVNLSWDHSFNLFNGAIIRTSLSTKIRTAYRLSWADSDYPVNYQEGYHMDDVQAIYTSPEGMWSLSGFVKNIWNYAEKRMYMNGPGNIMSIGNPRTYGSVLSVKF